MVVSLRLPLDAHWSFGFTIILTVLIVSLIDLFNLMSDKKNENGQKF